MAKDWVVLMQELYKDGFEVQSYTKTDDGLGGWEETWTPALTISGVLDLRKGDTTEVANKQTVNSTHILLTDTHAINEKQRILYDSKVYYVDYVDNPVNIDSHLEIYLRYEGDSD